MKWRSSSSSRFAGAGQAAHPERTEPGRDVDKAKRREARNEMEAADLVPLGHSLGHQDHSGWIERALVWHGDGSVVCCVSAWYGP